MTFLTSGEVLIFDTHEECEMVHLFFGPFRVLDS